ncbi:hypothetical protein L13192_00963 [Pyrenophora tritici-repentis]|uniref:Uncharacterized protein n=1 Tax=Pyrenophora tritici-repentis TaxID=45151 RepID=A0A922N998_9PLEO|nr:hypothetical protein Ptr86124_007566 [Pyrenophora tritici-repentis]KAI1674216.1 hypothetical protein L13192_00963 [Pyrenophora tritici-repentis]KAI1688676.1 hypothetical protein KJE20_01854 [Pyrenophora tritici-repentis]
MDASTRLYKRLGEIPEDPNDPESLDDLIVCAFGAFERYYVCWKTKGGEFKSDSYDLPPALRDFLYPDPSSGITRDHASLQVVFGRGEEYFASDNNGKLEFKEPAETRKSLPPTSNGGDNDEEGGITNNNTKADRQALRRSRTVSFLRPLSEMSVRSDTSFGSETSSSGSGYGPGSGYGNGWSSRNKRSSSSASSTRVSRPPSLSFASSRSNSEVSMLGMTIVEGEAVQTARPGWMQMGKMGEKEGVVSEEQNSPRQGRGDVDGGSETVLTTAPALISTSRTAPTSYPSTSTTTAPCTCGCHAHAPSSTSIPTYTSTYTSTSTSTSTSPPPKPRPTYTSTSTQTTPPLTSTPTPRAALRINTSTPSNYWSTQTPSHGDYSAISQASTSFYSDYDNTYYDDAYYEDDEVEEVQPVPMGRMSMLFSKPGYQLGDGLMGMGVGIAWDYVDEDEDEGGGYEDSEEEGVVYEYKDTFGEEVMR